ncbi:MAG: N-acetyltransferase [Sphingobacteriales bacterium]|nr:MAG: N-acetyltransferase [Sphingobacteriales bacterium]
MLNKVNRLNINTQRLKIRDLETDDLVDFHAYRSNPDVTKYQGFDVFTLEQAKSFIEDNAAKIFGVAGQWVQYAIESGSTGKLIGDCAIKLDQYDTRLAEIGITISPNEQKKGFAKETLIAILTFLFNLEGFHRVTEIVDAENVASIRLLESLGFRREGHFIENIYFKGKWGSEYQYAMLKREWVSKNV